MTDRAKTAQTYMALVGETNQNGGVWREGEFERTAREQPRWIQNKQEGGWFYAPAPSEEQQVEESWRN